MPSTIAIIQASYSKVGPTSVSDSSVAMKKRIQNRVINGPANANPPLVIVILTVSEYPVGFVAVQYVIPTRVEPGYTSSISLHILIQSTY